MNLSEATLARSDQLNADDLVSGPRVFTVKEVRRGDNDQPVAIVLAEYPADRPFKPSKTVVRILSYAWGEETDEWPETPRFTLYRDAKVKWGGQEIGGIRVSHMSHIEGHPDLKGGQLKIALAESKGKKSLHTIKPLTTADIVASLRNEWKSADPERKAAIEAEVARLQGNPQTSGADPAGATAAEAPTPPVVDEAEQSAPESADQPLDGELLEGGE